MDGKSFSERASALRSEIENFRLDVCQAAVQMIPAEMEILNHLAVMDENLYHASGALQELTPKIVINMP